MTTLPAISVFAKRLKQAREARGLSQRELGDHIGLGKQVGSTRINRYEQQKSRCDMDTAAQIAKELGVPLAFLFAESDTLAEMILAFSKLTKGDQGKLLAELKKKIAAKAEK
ncbi:helix-turn-helix domain-containing protein [Lysobacter niastensis]|uniref:Helix-turn-helix transcriptional regulator n=1 Tax=Lysobacter niastensis TaxID=380629 RepID=A0ABS0B3N7_9GAMM|nr:helix-turn-helix transcriptional regulator [Lysobacter niastensis]MBF6023089.1 helix-turn-helix transcriptional regulator [Lysobacter niastensis]